MYRRVAAEHHLMAWMPTRVLAALLCCLALALAKAASPEEPTSQVPSQVPTQVNTLGNAKFECVAGNEAEVGLLGEGAYIKLKNGATICRVISGMWQLSGSHGYKPRRKAALRDMRKLIEAGFTTFDLADHYGPAEDFVGSLGWDEDTRPRVQFHTKWVPSAGPMTESVVLEAMDVSRKRMRMETLDLVAFHWWEYDDTRFLDLLTSAQALSARFPPVLRAVSLTNFDTTRLKQIVEHGVDVVSNQVSFSIVDTRPLDGKMTKFAHEHGIKLLTYGTLLGGLLSDQWLGKPEPKGRADLPTASLSKYYRFVKGWGDWPLFQELLRALKVMGDRHGVSIAAVASRWVLQQQSVGGVILGMRLGHSAAAHIEENKKIFSFTLTADDMGEIAMIQARGMPLSASIGDCGDEYRQ